MKYLSVVYFLFFAFNACLAQNNPFIRDLYTADPSAHVWADGRLYVYPSHDVDPPRGCDLMDRYHVYSTDDMVHWTDHVENRYCYLPKAGDKSVVQSKGER